MPRDSSHLPILHRPPPILIAASAVILFVPAPNSSLAETLIQAGRCLPRPHALASESFQWCDADTKNPIDSLYVFPGDAKFEKVKQSKDRVYILEFGSTQQRFFYWFQDEDKTKDEENAKKIHNAINGITEAPGVNGTPA